MEKQIRLISLTILIEYFFLKASWEKRSCHFLILSYLGDGLVPMVVTNPNLLEGTLPSGLVNVVSSRMSWHFEQRISPFDSSRMFFLDLHSGHAIFIHLRDIYVKGYINTWCFYLWAGL